MSMHPSALEPAPILEPVPTAIRHAGWAIALRGIVAVVFGAIAIRSPGAAAAAIVVLFAVYAFADAILDLVLAVRLGRAGHPWGWYLVEGLASVALGVIALAYPGVTLVTLVLLVGLRALALGVVELVAAFSWKGLDSRWLLGLAGAMSIALGVILLASPVAGAFALIWTIGVYGLVFGVALFALGLRMMSAEREGRALPPAPPLPS